MNNAQLLYPAALLAIVLHASEATDIAAIVACLPTASALIKHPIHALPNANPGLCLETKEPYEFAQMKGGEKQERLLHHWSKQNKAIMQCLCEQYNDIGSLLSALPSFNSCSLLFKKVDM